MSSPYVGEVRMFGGNFAPNGWMFCQGQLLPISEYETLFQLIGTTFGGDGQSTFALPDLQGRVPINMGTNAGTTFVMGDASGTPEVTLTTQQIPQHNHALFASTGPATSNTPENNITAESATLSIYEDGSTNAQMSPAAVGPAGGSQPHDNMQPYLCVSFIISLFGIFPSQS
jgi:microcystin-dependent protein